MRDRSFSRIQAMPPNGDVHQPPRIHVRNVANLVDAFSLQPSVDFFLYLDFAALKYRHFHYSTILADIPSTRQQQTRGALNLASQAECSRLATNDQRYQNSYVSNSVGRCTSNPWSSRAEFFD